LVDARFIDWLGGKDDADRAAPRLESLRPLLEQLMDDADLGADLVRIYWYGSEAPEPLPGLVFRWVAPETSDTGVSMVLSLSRDLMALAHQGACEQVLVASDDDRLLPVMDHVQTCGLRVGVLAEESAQDLAALARTDPAWASIMRQADARWIVSSAELERHLWGDGASPTSMRRPSPNRDDTGMRNTRHRQSAQGPVDDGALRAHLGPMVAAWWTATEIGAQAELARQLPEQRGLPQEADRSLLLHLSQQLGRPLTLQEKKAMREIARDVVAGSDEPAQVPGALSVNAAADTRE
jgi:hypothetical protein